MSWCVCFNFSKKKTTLNLKCLWKKKLFKMCNCTLFSPCHMCNYTSFFQCHCSECWFIIDFYYKPLRVFFLTYMLALKFYFFWFSWNNWSDITWMSLFDFSIKAIFFSNKNKQLSCLWGKKMFLKMFFPLPLKWFCWFF